MCSAGTAEGKSPRQADLGELCVQRSVGTTYLPPFADDYCPLPSRACCRCCRLPIVTIATLPSAAPAATGVKRGHGCSLRACRPQRRSQEIRRARPIIFIVVRRRSPPPLVTLRTAVPRTAAGCRSSEQRGRAATAAEAPGVAAAPLHQAARVPCRPAPRGGGRRRYDERLQVSQRRPCRRGCRGCRGCCGLRS